MLEAGQNEAGTPKVSLWPGARDLILDEKYPEHVASCGVGWGKTVAGCIWLLHRAGLNGGGYNYCVVAPTNKLLKGVNLDFFLRFLTILGMKEDRDYKVNRSDLVIDFIHTKDRVFFVTADNYKTIVAFTFAGIWQDEPGWVRDEVSIELGKRLRANARCVQRLRTGVPQGTGASGYFDECTGPDYITIETFTARDKVLGEMELPRYRTDGRRMILHAGSTENPTLDAGYIDRMADQFGWSKNLWLQQVYGIFVSASNNSLYDFSEESHFKELEFGADLYLSWDFNVGQVTWVLGTEHEGRLWIAAENGSDARDTSAACRQFIDRFGHRFARRKITVTGDASGWSGDTRSSYANDYVIIQEMLEFAGFEVDIVAPRSNPPVQMRIESVNRLFNENPHTGSPIKLYLHPSCKQLAFSLQRSEPDGRGGIAKPSGDVWTHPADALGYLVWLWEPIERPQFGSINMAF